LYQDLKAQVPLEDTPMVLEHKQVGGRGDASHTVTVTEPDSNLRAAFAGNCRVNSLHHQAIKRLGRGLKVTAHAEDGLIEGFEAKYGEAPSEIEFGDYHGQLRWKTVMHIPDQRIRDAVQNLVVYQGDTEFASVEQQRRLFETAPSRYDYLSLVRVMTEEMRHGWQMSHVLITQFGRSGRIEAQKLLERRAFTDDRLLGAFNQPVKNWLDFFTYTQFVDRDGKFQLTMLSHSGFLPLGRSMPPMLKEESFHLGTGNSGLRRIVQAGKIPIPILQ